MRKKAAKRAALKTAAAERQAERREKLITTTEDWHPAIDGAKVRVVFILLSTDEWRVCAWGGDDFGMERDFPHVERQEAKALFEKLVDGTTQAQMRGWGMGNV